MTSSPTTATSWFLWLTCSNPTSTFIIIERLRGSRSFFCATAKKQNSKKTKRQKDKKTKSQREEERKRQSDKKKKGQRQKPFNGSAMNSPPTPPYCGSVAAALHLMNSQCGSCREKVSVYRLAMDATRQGDDEAGWKSGACSGISSRHSIKGSSEPFASSARGFSGFCLSFIRSISEQFVLQKQEFFSINAH